MAMTNLKGRIFLHNLLVSKHTLNFYSFHHLRFLFHLQACMDKDEKPALQQHPTDSMKDQTFDLSDEFDQTPERFQCCICLDLLYKPIVLACGHISCFWCVHKAMCIISVQSYCPICRQPFHHFPSICQLLHSLLVKLYPVAYKRRAKQVLEEEKKIHRFSPQFDDHLATERMGSYSDHISSERSNMKEVVDTVDCDTSCHDDTTTVPENSHPRYPEGSCNITLEETILPDDDQANSICEQVSIDDVLCVACKQLLIRPSVFNCGHVYCESCIMTAKDGSLTCQLCQSPHPGGFPKVCLELDNFLVEQFPKEHSYRRETLQNKVCCHQEGLSAFEKEDSKYSHKHGSKVHIGFGCDTCGVILSYGC
eukprot:TRINITY_DN5471_c0_g1_i1.p1 TRINITY_DN5471_c0_g1~~TRINITY_DN5471_c0_g1_i1.p1  ORF type:complete len:407 (-),score=39.37 TRINITY_DN5471_c0_g1_i1:2244-3341(-)